jgi:hypothetical protein
VDGDGAVDLYMMSSLWVGADPWTGWPQTEIRGNFFLNRGAGAFSVPKILLHTDIIGPYESASPLIGDMDHDGDPDILLAFRKGSQTKIGIGWNESTFAPGTPTTGASPPLCLVGTAAIGNAAFALSLVGGYPNAPAALGISHGTGVLGIPPAAIWLDLSPQNLILPSGSLGLMQTDGTGGASFPIPIPSDPLVQGASLYAQWLILDPAGGFSLAGQSYTLTAARRVIVW